jgi:hypothetical protein
VTNEYLALPYVIFFVLNAEISWKGMEFFKGCSGWGANPGSIDFSIISQHYSTEPQRPHSCFSLLTVDGIAQLCFIFLKVYLHNPTDCRVSYPTHNKKIGLILFCVVPHDCRIIHATQNSLISVGLTRAAICSVVEQSLKMFKLRMDCSMGQKMQMDCKVVKNCTAHKTREGEKER